MSVYERILPKVGLAHQAAQTSELPPIGKLLCLDKKM